MPTLRFEGASLEEAVEAARGRVGPAAKIVAANRVRRGGVGGFFAREHVEIEVQVEAPGDRGAPGRDGEGEAPGPVAAVAPVSRVAPATPRRGLFGGQAQRRADRKEAPSTARSLADDDGPATDHDPLSDLIEEMAQNGPSSVLDLAEQINHEQARYSLAGPKSANTVVTAPRPIAPEPDGARVRRPIEPEPGPAAAIRAPAPMPAATGNFAAVLERIARQEGLVPPSHLDEIIPDEDPEIGPEPAPVRHAGAILPELGGPVALGTPVDLGLPQPAPRPSLVPEGRLSNLGTALFSLGFPLSACQIMATVSDRQSLETELLRALEQTLPPLPPLPRAASSVIAVVGPRGQVMTTARALAADVGAPADEVALATQRNIWRQQDRVIASPEAAREERRSWRWRGRPSVVAVEMPVRPEGAEWASSMLRALEPTICWGVAEASHKPEDVAAWSRSLGGLDVLALVDLEGTTTPAAALSSSVPVGRLGDQPATAEAWSRALCARLMG